MGSCIGEIQLKKGKGSSLLFGRFLFFYGEGWRVDFRS